MSLYDDALNKYESFLSSSQISFLGNNYFITDIASAGFLIPAEEAALENAAGLRCIFMPHAVIPISITNAQYLSLVKSAQDLLQQLNDIYYQIVQLITSGTITTTGQIDSTWITLTASYTTNRVTQPTNEALASSIASIPVQVQSNWTQGSSGATDFIKNKPSLATVATSGSYSDLNNKPSIPSAQIQSDWTQASTGSLDYIKNKPAARSQSAASRSLNVAFQISASRDSLVNYSVDVSCTISLTTGQTGTVFLEIASDSGFTTNVQELSRFVNSNSGTLTIGLNLIQALTGTMSGFVPSGYYCRLRTANTVSTPTFTYRSGQEILL